MSKTPVFPTSTKKTKKEGKRRRRHSRGLDNREMAGTARVNMMT